MEPAKVKAFLNPRTNHERPLRPLETIRRAPGESFLVEMPGGGGYGDPHERPAADVLEDVKNGHVSIEAAERDYGVAIDAASLIVDERRTAQLRK